MFFMVLMLGIDTWMKLHVRFLAMHASKFKHASMACRKKFIAIFKVYKEKKMADGNIKKLLSLEQVFWMQWMRGGIKLVKL